MKSKGAATLAVCVLMAGCGTTTITESPGKPTTAPGNPDAPPPRARLGDPLILKGTDTTMEVTVLKVIDPVAGGQFDTPSKGHRFVGVQVRLHNVGGKTYDDSPSNGAHLIVTGDQQADSATISGGDCSLTFGSSATISPGSKQQGCLPFEVKRGTRPKTFQFQLDSGFGPQTGEWSLR